MEPLQRKYVDLICGVSSQYINWDGKVKYEVGQYGALDKTTGEFIVEGNVYDPEFQEELTKHKVKIKLADLKPRDLGPPENIVIATRTARSKDFPRDKELEVPGIANAAYKGHWEFDRRNRRDAILVLHNPRKIGFPPEEVLEPLYRVDKLIDKRLITSITVCSGYSMYLSPKSTEAGRTASIALIPASSDSADPSALTWWTDTSPNSPTIVLNNKYDPSDKAFMPLFEVQRPIMRRRRFFRDKIRPEPEGDDLWCSDPPPWDPLDEDGVEDPLEPEDRTVDPFETPETLRQELEAEFKLDHERRLIAIAKEAEREAARELAEKAAKEAKESELF